MKKKSRRHRRKNRARASKKAELGFSILEIAPSDHETVKSKMREQAMSKVADFPNLVEIVATQLRRTNPQQILTSFAVYGLSGPADSKHRHGELPLDGIQQHHAELLQALAFTIPIEDWGTDPLTPDVMQTVFDAVEKLSETFYYQRILVGQEITDEEEWAVMAMQESVRFYTFGVRNWGYFSDVVKITTELYGSLDQSFSEKCGFGITEFAQVMKCAIDEFERHTNQHFETLAKVMQGNSPQELVKLYWENVPGLIESAEEFLAALPAGVSRENVARRLKAHLDFRLPECATFKADEIAALTGCPVERVTRILRAISRPPGASAEANIEHLFLNNPIWSVPGIDLGERFFFPIPQAVFSHIHPIVFRLGVESGLKDALETARATYLESKLGKALAVALPGASIQANVKWRMGDQEFENDFLAILDRTVVIAEAKSHRVTPEGLRGAPQRLKRHVKDLILAPSIQSKRLEDCIEAGRKGDDAAIRALSGLGIEPSVVDRVIRLSVTLEELPLVSSAEGDLKRIGWIPADHQLAPSIPISDFLCIIDILENPILTLHYLSERTYIQKTFDLLGIEPDFLGLYLETGFTVQEFDQQSRALSIVGLSQEIDRYFDSLTTSKRAIKPKPKLNPLFRSIVVMLDQRRPNGWTTLGLHLLNSTSFAGQRTVEKQLAKLRKTLRKNFRDPQQKNAFQISPSENRKAHVVFYLYPHALRLSRKKVMQHIGSQAVDSSPSRECCVIAKCVDEWQTPYHAACVIRGTKPD